MKLPASLRVAQTPCYQDVPGSNLARKTKKLVLRDLLPHLVFTVKSLISEGIYTNIEASCSTCYQDVRGSNLARKPQVHLETYVLTYKAAATLGFIIKNLISEGTYTSV